MTEACWCAGNCPHEKPIYDAQPGGDGSPRERVLRRVLIDAPGCKVANRVFAETLTQTNRAAFAIAHALKSDAPQLLAGQAMRALARDVEALRFFHLAIKGNEPAAFLGLIGAYEAQGDLDKAEHWTEAAIKAHGATPDFVRARATLFARRGHYAAAVDILRDATLPILLLDRGRYLDKIGEFDRAWADWLEGKRLMRANPINVYRRQLVRQIVEMSMQVTSAARWPQLADLALQDLEPGPQPFFILGHPRSGTTMAEQAISMHSAVMAGDELRYMYELSDRIPGLVGSPYGYPFALMALTRADNAAMPNVLRRFYMRSAREKIWVNNGGAWPRGQAYFTDKMPLNEMHLPLIRLLFPSAPAIYMRRHPLDIVVSNLSHWLTHGWYYATALDTIAENYELTDRLLVHFRGAGLAMDEIKYESFVGDHRAAIDAILARAGLESEDACYEFHLNPRTSRTISYDQVKRPLYDSSVGRYKNYLHHLAPVLEVLAPIAQREGYTI